MVEHDVEDDPQPLRVRRAHQRHQILAGPEARVHVEEVLDRVAVKGVEVPALLQHRSHPDRGDAETGEVVELRLDPFDRAALEATVPASRPASNRNAAPRAAAAPSASTAGRDASRPSLKRSGSRK